MYDISHLQYLSITLTFSSLLQNLNGSLSKSLSSLKVYFRALEETAEVNGFRNNATFEWKYACWSLRCYHPARKTKLTSSKIY